MDWKSAFEQIQKKSSKKESVEVETAQIWRCWDDDEETAKSKAATIDFLSHSCHEKLKKFLLSRDQVLEEVVLSVLERIVSGDSNRDIRIYFTTDAAAADALVRLAGKEGEKRKCCILPWLKDCSLQALSLEIIDSLAEVIESRMLLVPRIAELKRHVGKSSSEISRLSLHLAIAKLIGTSDLPQDLDTVNQKEVIEAIVYAFANGHNKHLKSDARRLMHTAPAVRALANNEKLRSTLLQCNIVDVLSDKLTGQEVQRSESCMESVVAIVVNLALDKPIAETMRSKDYVWKLTALTQSPVCCGAAQMQVKQALWLLESKGSLTQKRSESAKARLPKKHVMISYSWSQKALILKLNQLLKSNNVPVWIDVEQMTGSTLDAMAAAVENSSVVLICASQSYKESSNCQIEGEYVHETKKPFLPVLVQDGYKATGWLGALLGSKLYYDVSRQDKFDSAAQQLLEEILRLTDPSTASSKVKALPPIAPPLGQSQSSAPVDWNCAQVADWLRRIGLHSYSVVFEQQAMDGLALHGLSLLDSVAFVQISNDLGLLKVGHKLTLLHSLQELFRK